MLGLVAIIMLSLIGGGVEGFRRSGHRGGHHGYHHGGHRGGHRWRGRRYGYGPRRFFWGNRFFGGCKNGCTNIGKGLWGCQYPGPGPNDCWFANDCQFCGPSGSWWWML